MNTSQAPDFQEAILLTEYVIKMALVELSELDQRSIKTLQSVPKYKNHVADLIQGIETAVKSLDQVKVVARQVINQTVEVVS